MDLARRGALALAVTASLGAVTVATAAPAEAAPHRIVGGGWHHGGGWHRVGGWRHIGGWHRGFAWRHGYGFGVRRFAYGAGRPVFAYGGRLCPIGFHRVYGLGCRPNGWHGYGIRPVRFLRHRVFGGPVFYHGHGWLGHRVHPFGYGFGRHFGGYGGRFHAGFGHPGFRHGGFGGHGFGGHLVRHR